MTEVEYTPGSWVVVAGSRTWVLLGVPPEAEVVGRCWDLLRGEVDLDEVLSAIVHEGFRAVGSFALLRYNDVEKRAVIRGNVRLGLVRGTGEREEVDAAGVATWIDRNLDGSLVELCLATGAEHVGTALPLGAGVVLASTVVVRTTAAARTTPVVRTTAVAPDPIAPAPPVVEEPAEHYDHFFNSTPRQDASNEPDIFTGTLGRQQVAPPVPVVVPQVPQRQNGVILHLDWAAPAPPQAVAPRPPAAQREEFTDTVLRTRQVSPDDTRQAVVDHTTSAPKVRAVSCVNGHLNPEHAVNCRLCGAGIPAQESCLVPRPPLGVLRLSTSDVITLDRGVVLGRNPQVERGPLGPHVVKLEGMGSDISRNHVEVRLEDWEVLVVDLGSKNGTTMTVPGWSPQGLAGHIPAILLPGARVTLGDGTFFTYEVAE